MSRSKMYKRYDKILNKGFKLSDFRDVGFEVSEKLDGSNASFTYDAEEKKMRAFSRNQELTEGNTLNGFYQYVQELAGSFDEGQLKTLSEITVFGEWLTKHTVTYKDECYNKFYVFDAYDKESEFYYSYKTRAVLFNYLELEMILPEFIYTPEDIRELTYDEILGKIQRAVGKSDLTVVPDTGEGIVIKSLEARLLDHDPAYKFVTDRFRETKGVKQQKPTGLQTHLVDYAITDARLRKILYKKLDEQVLIEEDLSLQNFGKVMGAVAKDFQDDILEEEMEEIIKQIRKRIGKQMPNLLRPILEEKDREGSDL